MITARAHDCRLYVVDPNAGDYAGLLENLQGPGRTVHFATTAEDALRLPLSRNAAWLVNMHLPDSSGLDLCKRIRQRADGAAVLLVSDQYDPEEELASRAGSSLPYVCKPVSETWLSHLLPAHAGRQV